MCSSTCEATTASKLPRSSGANASWSGPVRQTTSTSSISAGSTAAAEYFASRPARVS